MTYDPAVQASGVRAPSVVVLSDLRVAAGLMLAAAAVRPASPVHLGVVCPLRSVTGVPCPLCGMTTSVTETVHLDLAAAAAATPAGIAAVLVAVAVLVLPPRTRVRVPMAAVLAVLAAMWLWQLHRFALI